MDWWCFFENSKYSVAQKLYHSMYNQYCMSKVNLGCSRLGVVALVFSISFGIVMISIVPSKSFAQQEDKNSTIGAYALGYDRGKLNALNTFNAGGHYNGTCPPAHSTSYCVGYATGYNWEWAKTKITNWWMSSK